MHETVLHYSVVRSVILNADKEYRCLEGRHVLQYSLFYTEDEGSTLLCIYTVPNPFISAQELLGYSYYTMNMIFPSRPRPTLPNVTINQSAQRTRSLIGRRRRHGGVFAKHLVIQT